MKKKYTPILLAFVTLLMFNCKSSTSKTDSITYGYNENFKLSESEKEISSSHLIDLYETIWDYPEFNLPINKVISHDDYQIFIAAAIENNLEETIEQVLNTKEFNFINKEESEKFTKQLLYTHNGFYIYSVIYAEKVQDIPFVISWVSKNEELISKAYNNQKLDEKIN